MWLCSSTAADASETQAVGSAAEEEITHEKDALKPAAIVQHGGALEQDAAEEMPRTAVDCLSDEVVEELCSCVPGVELLKLAVASKAFGTVVASSISVWKHLALELLGKSICALHTSLALRRSRVVDVGFWRWLFRCGRELRAARWSLDLRAAFLESVPEANSDAKRLKSVICGSGHCSVGLGRIVVKVGGLRPECPLTHVHASAFDLQTLTMRDIELTADSAKPERRLRHAACQVRPKLTGANPAVLVLGGCDDQTKRPCQGGLKMLHILEILKEDGSLGRWHSVAASGQSPAAIWHHVCGSFAGGTKVVVSGGDFPVDDPEFDAIRNRSAPANFVYMLDLSTFTWTRTPTTGPAPTWRSLHAGFTHRDISSHSERLVIVGGAAEHVRIFSSSDSLADMRGHALDLRTLQWQPQPAHATEPPPARLRLATEKFGEWLLLYGGHGEQDSVGERVKLHKLNLRTLRWGAMEVRGAEGRYPAAPAATLTAGLVVGGVQFGIFGISTVPKFDVLTLCQEQDEENAAAMEEAAKERGNSVDNLLHGSDSEDEQDGRELVQMTLRSSNGQVQQIVMPRIFVQRLLSRRSTATAGADDDSDARDRQESSDDNDSEDEDATGASGDAEDTNAASSGDTPTDGM